MAFVVKRTLVVAVLLGALGILVGWYTYNSTFREVRERLTSEATLLAEHTARSLEGIDLTLQELVRVIEAEWQSGNPPSAAYHQALRKRVGALSQVTSLVIVDRNGRLISDQATETPRDLFLGEREYFRVQRDGLSRQRLFIGDPVKGGVVGKSYLSTSYAITAPSGGFGGVVAATFDPFFYRRFYDPVKEVGQKNDVALIDGEGVIMASTAEFDATTNVTIGAQPLEPGFRPISSPGGFMRVQLPSTMAVHLAVMVKVPMFPLYAFVTVPEAAAFQTWRRLILGVGAAWLVAVLSAAAAFLGIWRREEERSEAFEAMEQANREASAAAERAEAASAAKSRFLAHMSHELRTPLNAILGFSEVIRDRMVGVDPARSSEYAGLIHTSGRHLLQIINDMLDLSRIEAGKMTLHPEFLALDGLFDEVRFLVSQDFKNAGVELDSSIPRDCPPLYVDEKAAKQILVNLLSNAAKFSETGSSVELRASPRPDGRMALVVTDHGIGIPPDKIESVFEPFGQADVDTTTEGQGTGLGLPLVKSLIEVHGGSIEIDSRRGGGTCVTLTFPPPPDDLELPEPEPEPVPELRRQARG